jgi:hypothetical protein
LRDSARYDVLDVPRSDGGGHAEVMILFCSACGYTIDDVILPGDERGSDQ